MKCIHSKRWTLAWLFILFSAPGLLAFFFYKNPSLLQAKTVNQGQLVTPPIAVGARFGDKQRWRLVYQTNQTCDKACLATWDKIARVRLALGRRYLEVDQWLLINKKDAETLPSSLYAFNGHVAQLQEGEALLGDGQASIFLVNKNHDIVLTYPISVSLNAIYRDLNHLLKQGY